MLDEYRRLIMYAMVSVLWMLLYQMTVNHSVMWIWFSNWVMRWCDGCFFKHRNGFNIIALK